MCNASSREWLVVPQFIVTIDHLKGVLVVALPNGFAQVLDLRPGDTTPIDTRNLAFEASQKARHVAGGKCE